MAAPGAHSSLARTWLVWCFDQCHAPEEAELKAQMQNLADMFGFDFLCFKKCMSFQTWLEGRTGSILLVAEWREAKPIMEAIHSTTHQPDLRTLVVVRSEQMRRRACMWAQNHNQAGSLAKHP